MKYLMLIALPLLFMGFVMVETSSPEFVGTITYTLDTEASDAGVIGKAASTISISCAANGISRWEEVSENGSRVVLTDMTKQQQYVLVELLGKKIAIITPKDQVTLKAPVTVALDACCKTVLNKECQSLLTGNGELLLDTSHDLQHPLLPNVEGTPMSFNLSSTAGNAKYVASDMKEGTPDASLFVVPSEYEAVKASELQALFSQMGSDK
ncbi:hypothetical protein [Sanyastnella coralliicola]|uniref:hypothetical protein n=1 Tax=Sanyastnella coralliicola TaxID=3069118 RepID=UPI0027BA5EA2|nr:hypothetical protein [Longitalea sp. SCSIO 12813]